MDVEKILESLKENKITVNQAKKLLSLYSIEEIEGFAKIDISRQNRRGIPEVIFAETKKTALASMLQSCSLGLSIVNIDNGIAAGGIAANIANRSIRKKSRIF